MSMRNRRKRRCWDWFRSKKESVHPQTHNDEERRRNELQDERIAREIQAQEDAKVEEEPVHIITIDTNVADGDIKVMDFTPETDEEWDTYKYNCPVWLRYFNYILKGEWCENYLWHFWANDFIQMGKKNRGFTMRWPMCNQEDFKLQDVDLDDEVRLYGNTFMKTKQLYRESLQEVAKSCNNEKFLHQIDTFLDEIEAAQYYGTAQHFNSERIDQDSKYLK